MSRYRRERVQGGTYFFTAVLADRRSKLLIDEIDLLRKAYRRVWRELPFETVAVCVLPDHLHAVWRLPPEDDDYPTRWRLIKAEFSKSLPTHFYLGASKRRKGERGIWQRRYWEHRIRNAIDQENHVNYIHYNPVKHGMVERVIDWPYSSFHRYVAQGVLLRDWAGCAEFVDVGNFGE